LAFIAFVNWFDGGEFGELLRWSQTVVDLAGGDPAKGAGFGVGSPLAVAVAFRGVARWWLGRPGWRQDLHDAVAMALRSNPTTLALVVTWTYGLEMAYGVLRADDSAVCAIKEAVRIAEGTSNDSAVGLSKYALGVALLYRDAAVGRHRGLELMVQTREFVRERGAYLVPVIELLTGRERAGGGDRDAAIVVMRQPWTICTGQDGSGLAFGAPAFWWRRFWSVAPRATWPTPKRRSTGWRTCRPIKVRQCTRLCCCVGAPCWPALATTMMPTATIGTATAPWRNRLASKDTSPGRRRCEAEGARPGRADRHRATRSQAAAVIRGQSTQMPSCGSTSLCTGRGPGQDRLSERRYRHGLSSTDQHAERKLQ